MRYDPVSKCSGGQLSGMTALADAIYDELDPAPPSPEWGRVGYNCRPMNGAGGPIPGTVSVHGGGRALDVRADAANPTEKAYGDMLAGWLVGNAEILGVQCVMWNRRIWGGQSQRWFWRNLGAGAHPHHDHVHFELNAVTGATLTTETVMQLIGPPAEFVENVLAIGLDTGTGRYPSWDVFDDGSTDPRDGAPALMSLAAMLEAAFGVSKPNHPITRVEWDPIGRKLVMISDADQGVFRLPLETR